MNSSLSPTDMRLKIAAGVLLALLCCTFGACDEEDCDPPSVMMTFLLQNEAGENLLDRSVDGNVADDDIYFVFDGKRHDESPTPGPVVDFGVRDNKLHVGIHRGYSTERRDCELHVGDRTFSISYEAVNRKLTKYRYWLDGEKIRYSGIKPVFVLTL